MSIVLIWLDGVCFRLMGLVVAAISFGGQCWDWCERNREAPPEARKDTPCKEAKSRWNPKQERMSEHDVPLRNKNQPKNHLISFVRSHVFNKDLTKTETKISWKHLQTSPKSRPWSDVQQLLKACRERVD